MIGQKICNICEGTIHDTSVVITAAQEIVTRLQSMQGDLRIISDAENDPQTLINTAMENIERSINQLRNMQLDLSGLGAILLPIEARQRSLEIDSLIPF